MVDPRFGAQLVRNSAAAKAAGMRLDFKFIIVKAPLMLTAERREISLKN
jgi:hypothetical protein